MPAVCSSLRARRPTWLLLWLWRWYAAGATPAMTLAWSGSLWRGCRWQVLPGGLTLASNCSCIRQFFALQHSGKSCVMQAIVGPTKRFHHTHDVDASDTRVVGTPIAEREQGKLPIAFCADAVLNALAQDKAARVGWVLHRQASRSLQ